MSQRWTKRETDAFTREWLSATHRQGHQWTVNNPRCTACGRKYGPGAGALCHARKKPTHWRLHLNRALMRAQYPPTIPVLDAGWILQELASIRYALKHCTLPIDDRFWKYHKLARRHRMLLRRWWQLPGEQRPGTESGYPADHWSSILTRDRNKLLKQVRASGCPIVQVQGCTYRFKPDAFTYGEHGTRVPLFTDEAEGGR